MSSDEAIMFNNNLSYKLPTPTSVTTNRVLKRQYFQQRKYTQGQTMISQWNTGSDLVDTKNSALVLKVKVTGPAWVQGEADSGYKVDFGTGSVANLIRNIRIYHRSGTCYTNTQKLNIWRKIHDRFSKSEEWFKTVGALMGYDANINVGYRVTSDLTNIGIDRTSNIVTYMIPLDCLHPFFDPEGGVFIPANMASGLRCELDPEDLAIAFQGMGATSYEIDDCYFQTMNVTLMDSASASLSSVAQKQSLEYVFKDIFTSQNAQAQGVTQVNIDINKSVSYADTAMACVVLDNEQILSRNSLDTFFFEGKWDFTLGSNHYPNVKCDDKVLSYHNALLAFDKLKDKNGCITTLTDFGAGSGFHGISLERDTALAMSSQPVNASRSLRFELTWDEPHGASNVYVFLTYLTSIRSTLLKSKIDI
jgi:hypothetical protein